MKVLVTGVAGFIGSHIAGRLIKDGHEVLGIDDLSAGKVENIPDRAKFFGNDITNLGKWLFNDVDVIFHNAASKKNICLKDPQRDLEVNGGGTLNLLMKAKEAGVKKFIHASTGSVYGNALQMSEETPCKPISYYGVSKLAGERYVDMFDIDTTILRYFHVYGDRQENDPNLGGVVAVFKRRIQEGKHIVIHGDGSQMRCFTHVLDVVEANIQAWLNPISRDKVYNIASGYYTSIGELAESMGGEIEYGPPLEGDIHDFNISNERSLELGLKYINSRDNLLNKK